MRKVYKMPSCHCRVYHASLALRKCILRRDFQKWPLILHYFKKFKSVADFLKLSLVYLLVVLMF